MPKEKQHFQFLRSSAVYDTLESAKTAIKGLNVKAGEPSIALYYDLHLKTTKSSV